MTDPFNPSAEPSAPEYDPGVGDPVEPSTPDVMPDPTPEEVPEMRGLKSEGAPDGFRTGGPDARNRGEPLGGGVAGSTLGAPD